MSENIPCIFGGRNSRVHEPKIIFKTSQVENQKRNHGDDWQSNDNIQTQSLPDCISKPSNPSARKRGEPIPCVPTTVMPSLTNNHK